jgi:CheY-like chemotaxis protein
MNTQPTPITDAEPGVSFHNDIRHEAQLCSPVGQPTGQFTDHKRILIVDDEAGVTRTLKLNLEATAGYEVRTENDSIRVIDTAREFHPQLILMDVLMPHLDGCDVSARIHADPELKDTPIVFLTALAHNEDTGGHAVAAGSTVYLAKPVDTEELIKCIEQSLLLHTKPQRHAFTRHS